MNDDCTRGVTSYTQLNIFICLDERLTAVATIKLWKKLQDTSKNLITRDQVSVSDMFHLSKGKGWL